MVLNIDLYDLGYLFYYFGVDIGKRNVYVYTYTYVFIEWYMVYQNVMH